MFVFLSAYILQKLAGLLTLQCTIVQYTLYACYCDERYTYQMSNWKQSQVLVAAVTVMNLVCHQTVMIIMTMIAKISPSPTHVTTPTVCH